ncbi:hypothetical protein NPIL_272561 [Nephila pilipes]|uniref:Uncharacterized protein n=1 Tax=Nephila pilipes TaxID=299642 RepID=A0A8X6PZH1_NEPPI|nr:hypothetical protein NPIL_272561 [Nephila pilipes]
MLHELLKAHLAENREELSLGSCYQGDYVWELWVMNASTVIGTDVELFNGVASGDGKSNLFAISRTKAFCALDLDLDPLIEAANITFVSIGFLTLTCGGK